MTRKFSDYRIEIRPIPEGGYMASIPQLPGCMGGGLGPMAALSDLRYAFDVWTTAASDMGREVPEPDNSAWVPVSERLPETHQSVALVNINRWESVGSDWDRNVHQCGYLEEFDGPADQRFFWSVYGERARDPRAFTHWMPLPAPPKGTK